MNENIDLTKILKDCPRGWKFYSSVYGDVEFLDMLVGRIEHVDELGNVFASSLSSEVCSYPIRFTSHGAEYCVSSAGEHRKGFGECTFFPSKEQRDWSKFSAPWYKNERFDPKTLNPFDKVMVRHSDENWTCDFFSHIDIQEIEDFPYITISGRYDYCIPYNDDNKHLVGTMDEAPEFYHYWED